MGNYIGILGIIVILGIAVAFSSNRKAINLRVVGAAFALQAALAALALYWTAGQNAIRTLSEGVLAIIGFAGAGINMVFGPLANISGRTRSVLEREYGLSPNPLPAGELPDFAFTFAINVLPIIVFFAALMSVLYHLRIMEWLVKIVGGALHKIIGTGAIESMNAAANIFVGQTEAPLVVKPYLKGLTEPQFFAVMVSGLASIAGTVLAGYVLLGANINYLLAAAFMAAPGGLLMAKIIMPDTDPVPAGGHEKLQMERSQHGNVILAAASGTSDGLRLAVNIGAMLVAFVALIALFNGLVGWVFGLSPIVWLFGIVGVDLLAIEGGVTMQLILGKIFQPLMYLLSVPWNEAEAAGALFGEKIILNEFVAFSHLTDTLKGMSPRTIAVTTFSLCGFANLSSIAILLGGLGVLVPEKRELIGRFGMKCVLAASLSNLMSAALAGLMLTF